MLNTLIDAIIPSELAVAPNPYGITRNLKLTTVAVGADHCFELWQPTLGRLLLPQEAMLLKGDCPRLEEICAHLVETLGVHLISAGTIHLSELHSWKEARAMLGSSLDAIALHSPLAQAQFDIYHRGQNLVPSAIAKQQITFLKLVALGSGYQIELLPLRLQLIDQPMMMVA
jgi:hypothetical protein